MEITSKSIKFEDRSVKQVESDLYKAGVHAIDLFFREIKNIEENYDIFFMVDGDRSSIYRDIEIRSS